MGDYKLRKLSGEEFHILIPLMKDCFGDDESIEYFKWKFLNNPAGEFIGFIAEHESGEVGAYYGVIPEKYIVDGVSTIIFQSCDTMTHSKHRRKGLFQKLALHCYDYLREHNKLFVIGFGGAQSTPGFIKFGWKNPFYLINYFYPKILSYFNFFGQDADIVEIHDLSKIESLILKSNSGYLVHSEKNIETFKWRLDNPRHLYNTIALRIKGEYVAYAVYYCESNKIILFDFYFDGSDGGKALISFLKNKLKGSRFSGVISLCQQGSLHSKQLSSLGFIFNPFNRGPLSTRLPFIFFATNEEMSKYSKPSSWLINAFDHDSL